jgi:hypothetical protein
MNDNKYFIELPHEEQDCARSIQLMDISGYIKMFQWGCNEGNHTAVAIIDADTEDEVRNILPPILRPNARIMKLNSFTREEIADIHKMADGSNA